MARLSKKDILTEIDYYEKQLITDPGGKTLYDIMLEGLYAMLEHYKN